MAPAIRMDLLHELVMPQIAKGSCPHPSIYVLSDTGERDDDVWQYGKSLLYLVSNAFEGRRAVPLLGMEHFIKEDKIIRDLVGKKVDGLPSLILAGANNDPKKNVGSICRSESHGGFDNDPDTLNSVLYRILGAVPTRAFEARDLQF